MLTNHTGDVQKNAVSTWALTDPIPTFLAMTVLTKKVKVSF